MHRKFGLNRFNIDMDFGRTGSAMPQISHRRGGGEACMRFKMLAGGGAVAQPPVMRIGYTRGIGAEAGRSVLHHGWHSRTLRPVSALYPVS